MDAIEWGRHSFYVRTRIEILFQTTMWLITYDGKNEFIGQEFLKYNMEHILDEVLFS